MLDIKEIIKILEDSIETSSSEDICKYISLLISFCGKS
jgi:hypothetical protein